MSGTRGLRPELDGSPSTEEDLEPRLVTVMTAARLLSVGRTKVYALIDAGELRTVHVGVAVRIPLSEVDALVGRLQLGRRGRRRIA